MKVLLLVVSALVTAHLPAQSDNTYMRAEDSDPEAITLLERMENTIAEMDPVEADFTIQVDSPGEDDDVHFEGKYYQHQKAYRVETDDYEIFSDGKSHWMYDREFNEVVISDVEESGDFTTPIDYLRMYKQDDFVARILPGSSGDEVQCEIKPLDKFADYSKLRLTIESSTARPLELIVFEKSGDRMTLTVDRIEHGEVRPASWYVFDPEQYEGLTIEDIRLD